MGSSTFTEEFTSPVPAGKLFKALVLDSDNLLPKIMPQAFKSVETIEGNGGPGTIKKMNFTEGTEFKYLKSRVDALDKERMTYAYTIIEGGAFPPDKVESISYEVKLEATTDGGCKGTNVSKYNVKPGAKIAEEQHKEAEAKSMAIFKAVEAYILANPAAYA
ncbi:hypothetical protein LWI28_000231 [Acer negundo]|uniref:Bet v I/Major latex protein domain-containing protein n=1 Tax=Acer negundo TaxID=4023 RepID=A0AAD5P072_ACENE|nr:hypothetical protein LWI28_000231 [Acer negundo]KAK4855936.1 hypothetical protein QYF36_012498 [Acer negundo]